jgi:hypothetical protein
MPKATHTSIDTHGSTTRFSIGRTCDGYEVVDHDGRPVSNTYEHANKPLEIAAALNAASERGHRAVARVLARVEGTEMVIGYIDGDD